MNLLGTIELGNWGQTARARAKYRLDSVASELQVFWVYYSLRIAHLRFQRIDSGLHREGTCTESNGTNCRYLPQLLFFASMSVEYYYQVHLSRASVVASVRCVDLFYFDIVQRLGN